MVYYGGMSVWLSNVQSYLSIVYNYGELIFKSQVRYHFFWCSMLTCLDRYKNVENKEIVHHQEEFVAVGGQG